MSARDRYEHTRELRIGVGAYDFGYAVIYENDWMSESAWDHAKAFVHEWAEDNDYDLDAATESQVRDAVSLTIEANMQGSAFRAEAEFQFELILEWAGEQVDKWSPTMDPVEDVRLEGGEIVIVITRAFNQLRAAHDGTDVFPYPWRGASARSVIETLKEMAEVGERDIERKHRSEFDRWEPDTGSYRDLVAVAEQALKDSGWVPGEEDDEDDES